LDYSTRKIRWVLDDHKTPPLERSTYAGVVSRDSFRVALTDAALNDLGVWVADIYNAYLQAHSSQKEDYVICGPEFGLENVGKRALIRQTMSSVNHSLVLRMLVSVPSLDVHQTEGKQQVLISVTTSKSE
jgi:hypothetical protein